MKDYEAALNDALDRLYEYWRMDALPPVVMALLDEHRPGWRAEWDHDTS